MTTDQEKAATLFRTMLQLHDKVPNAPLSKIVTVALDEARYQYSGVAHGANPSRKPVTERGEYHRLWRKARKERAVCNA